MTIKFETEFSTKDFFQDFGRQSMKRLKKKDLNKELSTLNKEATEKKLEQELLTLKKRELYRQCISLVTMAPFALLMAIELEKVCSDQVLFGIINGALSHTILPFTVLSLICTLYLIYNNGEIVEKERELKDLKDGEKVEKKEHNFPSVIEYLVYIDAITTGLVIVGLALSEVSSLEVAEDAILFLANTIAFLTTLSSYIDEHIKYKKKDTEKPNLDEKFQAKTSNMSMAGLALAGASVFLIRRILLMALAPSLTPAVGPTLGLIGITLFMVIQVVTISSYGKTLLKDTKVEEKGPSHINTFLNVVNNNGSPNQEGPSPCL